MDKNFELPFGQYKGKTLGWVVGVDPAYIMWLDRTVKHVYVNNKRIRLEISKTILKEMAEILEGEDYRNNFLKNNFVYSNKPLYIY